MPSETRHAPGNAEPPGVTRAAASGIPRGTIARFELAEGSPQKRALAAIRAVLEAAGVEFIRENEGGPAVQPRKD